MGMLYDNAPFNCDKLMEKKFLELRDKYNVSAVIETGTYHGITTEFLANNFEQVYTIEVNPTFYDIAKERLLPYDNVNMYLGNSAIILGEILGKIKGNFIVFLDAHWYQNPVIGELEAIEKSKTSPIIIIHDFKNPHNPEMGYDIYPEQNIVYEWEWIEESVNKIYPGGYEYSFNQFADGAKRGCVFIIPKL